MSARIKHPTSYIRYMKRQCAKAFVLILCVVLVGMIYTGHVLDNIRLSLNIALSFAMAISFVLGVYMGLNYAEKLIIQEQRAQN